MVLFPGLALKDPHIYKTVTTVSSFKIMEIVLQQLTVNCWSYYLSLIRCHRVERVSIALS